MTNLVEIDGFYIDLYHVGSIGKLRNGPHDYRTDTPHFHAAINIDGIEHQLDFKSEAEYSAVRDKWETLHLGRIGKTEIMSLIESICYLQQTMEKPLCIDLRESDEPIEEIQQQALEEYVAETLEHPEPQISQSSQIEQIQETIRTHVETLEEKPKRSYKRKPKVEDCEQNTDLPNAGKKATVKIRKPKAPKNP